MTGNCGRFGWAGLLAFILFVVNSTHAQSGGYTAMERGPDWKVMQKTEVVNGTNHIHKYTELATGLNYTNASGQLVESKEEITILPAGGAVANHGRHTVTFPGDIYNGVLEVVTPDGKHLYSRPLGVTYDDGSNTVFIATLTNAVGYLTSSNQVTYRNCFSGIKADLVCTYRRGGFESDLVFREQPPTPEQCGLGADWSTLQMVTEFFNTQDPQMIPGTSNEWYGLQDSTLKFGKLTMKPGKAFAFNGTGTISSKSFTPVYKRWVKFDGRKFLVEEVPLINIAENLDALPLMSQTVPAKERGNSLMTSNYRHFPASHGISADTNQILLAMIDSKHESGVVLDYTTVDSDQTDFTFESGETYLIAGPVTLGDGSEDGTSVIFEGGAVIKFTPESAGGIFFDQYDVSYPTSPDFPAVFTSKDDDSVGAVINESTGNPVTLTNVVYLANAGNGGNNPENIEFHYAGVGVCVQDPAYIYNCRFYKCHWAVQFSWGEVSLFNVLFSECDKPVTHTGSDSGYQINAINVTADKGENFVYFTDDAESDWFPLFYYERCLFTRFDHSPIGQIGSDGCAYSCYEQSNTLCYTSAASANYYLATNSPYRNVGTTNIPLDFSEMTTYAPQDGGYPDTDAPDIGYHYSVNEDSDHDGIPDWWIWSWFGDYAHTGNDLDTRGNTLLYDYQGGNDPIDVAFSLGAANDYVNHTNVSLQVEVTAGRPACYAVIINGSTATNWLPFSTTNLSFNLGTTDGVYNVKMGLIGSGEVAIAAWQSYTFYLDRVAPHLAITNPVIAGGSATVIKPYLQLQGLADEPLASLSYDISNTAGLFTNLDAFVTGQYFDTSKFDFTTNYFQAFDVPLATNGNFITLRVTDRAGNTATTNFNVTLDYTMATNPPVVSLTWPEDNMAIYGTSFTVRGTISDETGTVQAQVVDEAGNTNIVAGLVERNGTFWVENLPLTTNGNHVVTLTATDAAGNVTTTNITVFESEVVLTIDSTPTGDDLYKPTGTVSGTVSESSWEVYVNGQRVNVDTNENAGGTYSWSADNVPIYGRGTATFDAVALPSGAASPPANNSTSVEFAARMEITTYHLHTYLNIDAGGPWPAGDDWTKDVTAGLVQGKDDWQKMRHGTVDDRSWDNDDGVNTNTPPVALETVDTTHFEWNDTNDWTLNIYYHDGKLAGSNRVNSVAEGVKIVPDYSEWGLEFFADGKDCDWFDANGALTEYEIDAKTELTLYTGGKAKSNRQNLFCIQGSGGEYKGTPWAPYGKNIPPEQMKAFGKNFGTDGKLWKVLPDNVDLPLGLDAPGKKHYGAEASPTKYKLAIKANSVELDPDEVVVTNCVGQKVTFVGAWDIDPGAASTDYVWNFSGKYVNHSTQANSHSSVNYDIDLSLLRTAQPFAWWCSGGEKKAYLNEILHFSNGQRATLSVSGKFNMYRPQFVGIANQSSAQVKIIGSRLGVGEGTAAVNSGDMQFDVLVQSSMSGNVNCLQLASEDRTYDTTALTSQCFNTGGQYWLDNNLSIAAKHIDPQYPQFVTHYWDSPSLSGQHWYVSVKDKFKTYVQFAPASSLNDMGDSIYVTLGIIQWDWEGSAQYITAWQLLGSNSVSGVTTQQSDEFPSWIDIITNPGDFHLCL
jgi:hypothetical protein